MRPVLVLRPQTGAAASVAAGREIGLAITAQPLFELRACEWHGPDPATVDALLVGSANAVRLGGTELQRYRGKPAHAVGTATAAACREAGLAPGIEGTGGLQQVLDALPPGPLRILRVAAREHVALQVPPGKRITLCIAYERVELPVPAALGELLREGALVLLYSAGEAHRLAQLCDSLAIDRGRVSLAALGPRIARAAGDGWRTVQIAPQIAENALLALALDMCH